MRAALGRGDRVGERVDGLRVGAGPLHRDLDGDAPLGVLRLDVDDVGVDELDLLGAVEVLHVVDEAAVVLVAHRARCGRRARRRPVAARGRAVLGLARDLVPGVEVRRALVGERDPQPLVEERVLLEPRAQGLEVVLGGLEDGRVGPERLRRARRLGRLAAVQLAHGLAAVGELLAPGVAVALDLGDHAGRERVDDRDADTVQTAGDGVPAAAELAARVEDRHDDLDGGPALGGVDRDGDATPVVDDAHPTVGEERHVDRVRVAGESLVHRVIHNLVHKVVEASLTGGADVHARTLADCLEALEDGDVARVVAAARRGCRLRTPSGRGWRCRCALPRAGLLLVVVRAAAVSVPDRPPLLKGSARTAACAGSVGRASDLPRTAGGGAADGLRGRVVTRPGMTSQSTRHEPNSADLGRPEVISRDIRDAISAARPKVLHTVVHRRCGRRPDYLGAARKSAHGNRLGGRMGALPQLTSRESAFHAESGLIPHTILIRASSAQQ